MKTNIKTIIKTIIGVAIATPLFKMNINKYLSNYELYINLKQNLKFILKVINYMFPILIIMIAFIVYKLFRKKWVFKIEKLNLGMASILLDNPEKIFKQQVKNFFNTKRTLFKIDENKDNFYETINSYYSVYNFLKQEIKIFTSDSSKQSKEYEAAIKMILELNKFLTKHQNNFKRWYEYKINNQLDTIYDCDIGEIQKDYRHYDKIVEDFKIINTVFCSQCEIFDLNSNRWN